MIANSQEAQSTTIRDIVGEDYRPIIVTNCLIVDVEDLFISIPQLSSKGLEVNFSEHKCTISSGE
jgi:hypothetical protein